MKYLPSIVSRLLVLSIVCVSWLFAGLHEAEATYAAALFSPNQNRVARVFQDPVAPSDHITLSNTKGQVLHRIKTPNGKGRIKSVAFSLDNKLLAFAVGIEGASVRSDDPQEPQNPQNPFVPGEVSLWDVDTGKLKWVVKSDNGQMRAVAFSFDGKTLAVGSGGGKIQLIDIATSKTKQTMYIGSWVFSLNFSPDGNKLVSASGAGLHIWNTRSGKIWKVFQLSPSENKNAKGIDKAAFSPDGKVIASYGVTGEPLRWWDVQSGKLLKTFFRKYSGKVPIIFPGNVKNPLISIEL